MQLAKGYVYDYETVINCFLAVFVNVQNPNDIHIFEISEFENDAVKLKTFLKEVIKKKVTLISYNGLKFDSQVSRAFITSNIKLENNHEMYQYIYGIAQETIKRSREKEFPIFNIRDNPFKEIDILAINNYDNPAKQSSLKWLQYSMDWLNVEDMSLSHDVKHTQRDIMGLKAYCINDCLSTRELFIRNKSEILLRGNLTKHFKIDLTNASEPKLAKSIFLKLLAKEMGIEEYELKKKRTYRKKLALREVILPYISFQTSVFKETLNAFKKLVLDGENLKGSFNREVIYRGMPITFALGGIHGAKKGIYKSDKNFIIKSFDVTSYYPNLAIRNKWAPAHIPKQLFCDIYEGFFEDRKKYDKKNPLNYVYKILLNSTYGLSNEDNSFLKDSMFTMRITVNGQLLLVMLMESICEAIPGARPVMINTDGAEIIIPREYEELYDQICKEWQDKTMLQLEFENYQKLVTPDINNYIGIYEGKEIDEEKALKMIKEFPKPLIKKTKDGRYIHYGTKCKGRFEIDKPLHKNKSYRINRIAFYNYFVHGIEPEKTLGSNKNIFDYCAGVRAKGEWKFVATCIEDGSIEDSKLPKTLRYYISNKGCKLVKVKEIWGLPTVQEETNDLFSDLPKENIDPNKPILLEVKNIRLEASSCMEQLANRIDLSKPFEEYDVDYRFYLKNIRKEIKNIDPEYSQAASNFYDQ